MRKEAKSLGKSIDEMLEERNGFPVTHDVETVIMTPHPQGTGSHKPSGGTMNATDVEGEIRSA